MNNNIIIHNGEIWLIKKLNSEGSMNKGNNLGIICQTEVACIRSPNATIIPISSKKKSQPTHVVIYANKETGLIRDSICQAEGITTISKEILVHRLGTVDYETMKEIWMGIFVHLGMRMFTDYFKLDDDEK
jgi:mRNA-degrading endonuclease toxin of MazEF toxin-antitoxin module